MSSGPIAVRQSDDLETAIKVVKSKNKPHETLADVERHGGLLVFTDIESTQLAHLSEMVRCYMRQKQHVRPLCLAIFGPPGSGKSFSVEQLVAEANRAVKESIDGEAERALNRDSSGDDGATASVKRKRILDKAKEEFESAVLEQAATFNLTQVPDAASLARALARTQSEASRRRGTPVIFFDEFDAPCAGAPYGWLPWFLAPMHDGEFVWDGLSVSLKRAVYVFAGGTAATMQEFSAQGRRPDFRASKGPDFVSRLRGFLDVAGPNAEPRMLRRSVILWMELRKRANALGIEGPLEPADELLRALLQVGRYVHGARSISAVVEMSNVDPKQRSFDFAQLPVAHILAQHADRGPLDPGAIHGDIALSGYTDDQSPAIKGTWLAVVRALWAEGATLAYGGSRTKVLMEALHEQLERRPCALSHEGADSQALLCRFAEEGESSNEPSGSGVTRMATPERSAAETAFLEEISDHSDRLWVVSAIWRFRKRLQISEMSAARFVMCGKLRGYNGRFSGIAEEVMLTLALGKPVYISGGHGGAAADVGALLGLARPWTGESLTAFSHVLTEKRAEYLEKFAGALRPPPLNKLPLTQEELVAFLKEHALGGALWPDNGLDVDQNRELFRCQDSERVAELVVKGLKRRFG